MDDLFCNQARAYGVGTPSGADLSAVILYEQLKEAIESVEKTVADDEFLSAIWYDPAGQPLVVEHIGYYNQFFIVFRGRDGDGNEYTALVPVHSAQLVLKKAKQQLREGRSTVSFIGHSVSPNPPATPSPEEN